MPGVRKSRDTTLWMTKVLRWTGDAHGVEKQDILRTPVTIDPQKRRQPDEIQLCATTVGNQVIQQGGVSTMRYCLNGGQGSKRIQTKGCIVREQWKGVMLTAYC